jgi:hypothetical protein
VPITLDAPSRAWTVFARLNAGIVGSKPTQGMNICVLLFCFRCSVCRQRPYEGLIPRPKSPTDCVYDYATEKAANVQQKVCRAIERETDSLALGECQLHTEMIRLRIIKRQRRQSHGAVIIPYFIEESHSQFYNNLKCNF